MVINNIIRDSLHNFERNGIVYVFVGRIARIGNADELARRIEQPAAGIARIQCGIDAD